MEKIASLPPRLRSVLNAAAKGLTDKEIAAELRMAVPTVESHWRRLRERYEASSRTEIVARYLTEGHIADQQRLMEELVGHRETARRLLAERESVRGLFQAIYSEGVSDRSEPGLPDDLVRDLSIKVGQESARANRATALAEAAASGGAHAFVFTLDMPAKFTLLGDNAFAVVGHSPEAIAGIDFLAQIIDPQQWEAISIAFPTAVADFRPDGFCYEYRIKSENGSPRWVITRASFEYGDGLFPISYSGFTMDVTGFWPNQLRLIYLKDGLAHDRTPTIQL